MRIYPAFVAFTLLTSCLKAGTYDDSGELSGFDEAGRDCVNLSPESALSEEWASPVGEGCLWFPTEVTKDGWVLHLTMEEAPGQSLWLSGQVAQGTPLRAVLAAGDGYDPSTNFYTQESTMGVWYARWAGAQLGDLQEGLPDGAQGVPMVEVGSPCGPSEEIATICVR